MKIYVLYLYRNFSFIYAYVIIQQHTPALPRHKKHIFDFDLVKKFHNALFYLMQIFRTPARRKKVV